MMIKSLTVENCFSFQGLATLDCSQPVTVIAGRNNAGKSNLLKCLEAFGAWGKTGNANRAADLLGEGRVLFAHEADAARLTLELDPSAFQNAVEPGTFGTLCLHLELSRTHPAGGRLTVECGGDPVDTAEFPLGSTLDERSKRSCGDVAVSLDEQAMGKRLAETFALHADRRLHSPDVNAKGDRFLNPDCTNVLQVLNFRASGDPKTFTAIVERARRFVPGLEEILAPMTPGDNKLSGQATERGLTTAFQWDEMASGTRHLLSILTLLFATPDGALLLLEEPESFVHPQATVDLFKLFEEVTKETGKQVIMTTHSPVIMEMAGASRLNIVVRDENNGVSRIERLNERADKIFQNRGLLKTFMFAPYGRGVMPAALLIVEGPDDLEIWNVWLKSTGLAESGVVSVRGGEDSGDPVDLALHLRHLKNAGIRSGPSLLVVDSDGDQAAKEKSLVGKGLDKSDFHVLAKKEIEDYLLDANAIADLFGADPASVANEIKNARPGKEGLNAVVRKFSSFSSADKQVKAMIASRVEPHNDLLKVIDFLKKCVEGT